MKRTTALFHSTLALAVAACSPDTGPNPVKEAFASAPRAEAVGAAVAFRFSERGEALLYRLPDLERVSWRFDAGSTMPAHIVGFAGDDDLIYALTPSDSAGFHLVALDLASGRTHELDSGVVRAAVGPTGSAYVVRLDGSVAEAEHRRTVTWPDTLMDNVLAVWGAARGRLLAAVENGEERALALLSRGQERLRQPIPAGDIAVSRWGDLVVVTTDSGLSLHDPTDPSLARFAPLEPPARLVATSPSAHVVYAVLGADRLVAVERFSGEVSGSLVLTGPVGAIRVDPLGRTLLARAEDSESVWIIDLNSFSLLSAVAGSWAEDLPAVATDGTVLLRQGNSVVSLSPETGAEVARAPAPPGDKWLTLAWDPRRPALEFAVDTATGERPTGAMQYVQVSSSRNPSWAQAFADELRGAGLAATVLAPDTMEQLSGDLLYRVVLGPFPTREEAEAAGRQLGRAFWIFTRETPSTVP